MQRRWLVGVSCAIGCYSPKPLMTVLGRCSLLPTVAPVGLHVERWGKAELMGGPLYLLSVGNSGSVCA